MTISPVWFATLRVSYPTRGGCREESIRITHVYLMKELLQTSFLPHEHTLKDITLTKEPE